MCRRAVVTSNMTGRSLVARTDIGAGSVVIDERPFVSVLSKLHRTQVSALCTGTRLNALQACSAVSRGELPCLLACWHCHTAHGNCGEVPYVRAPVQRCSSCFRRLPINPLFCRSCAAVAYCSAACREGDADAGHAAGGPECGLPWSALLPDNARLALRLALKTVPTLSSSANKLCELPRCPFLGA